MKGLDRFFERLFVGVTPQVQDEVGRAGFLLCRDFCARRRSVVELESRRTMISGTARPAASAPACNSSTFALSSAAGSIGCQPSPNLTARVIAAGPLPPIQMIGRRGLGRKTNDGNARAFRDTRPAHQR